MNDNMILNPGETILLMTNISGGKSVGGTRVFATAEEFKAWLRVHATVTELWKTNSPGDVVHSYTCSWGRDKGVRTDTILVRNGMWLSHPGNVYVASPAAPPKRFTVTPEMLGYTSGKTKTKKIKPSI